MTIYDIAKEAQVSIASVSRYFNHPEVLSPETREKISRVLEQSDFIPNQMARGLVLSTIRSVGIMMSDIQHQRFSTIAYNLERAFFEWGYNTLFCNTGDDDRKIQQYLYMLSSHRIDALILIGSMFGNPGTETAVKKFFPDIPIITSDVELDLPNSYSVTPDHNYGMRAAVRHLAEKGHTHLAFVASTGSINTEKKIDAFYRAVQAQGLPLYQEKNILRVPLSRCEDTNLDFTSILDTCGIPCTGLIFSTDRMAARAVSSLCYHGRRVPEDCAVIGYDNSPYSLCCQPPLTSIDTQAKTIARVIANLVNDIFNHKEVGSHVIIKSALVIRGST